MDIKLIPEGKTEEQFVFASLPEEISGSNSAKYQSFNIISKGVVKIPKGRDVEEISWDGVFFGKSKKNESIVKTDYWKEPNECVELMQKWLMEGTVLNLIVTDTWINVDVTISSFKPTAYGAFGNIRYSIVFEEARDLKIYTTKDLKIGGKTKKKKTKDRSALKKKKLKKYVLRAQDTLYKVALQHRGTGGDWIILYNKNSKILEAAAIQQGRRSSDLGKFLVPGTEITIP